MLELRPPLPEDADPLWRIARERGVMETTMGLASRPRTDYVERIEQPAPDQHTLVAVLDGEGVLRDVWVMGRLRPALERADD